MTKTIEVNTTPKYRIIITKIEDFLFKKNSIFIVEDSLRDHYITNWILKNFKTIMYEGGENKKTLESSLKLLKILDNKGYDRKTPFVVVGGGSFLDKVGFSLSIFHRGTKIIKIPTTLLSQVDAGIGVKNGINYLDQKNMLGCFKIPESIIIDVRFLETLSIREIKSGLAESIKISLIRSKDLFEGVSNKFKDYINKDFSDTEIIEKTIIAHIKQIEKDPFEDKIARPLDFGHEWGHRIEILSKHKYNHGEAISIGMAIDSVISYYRGYINIEELNKILNLFNEVGLPIIPHYTTEELWPGIELFRKHLGGKLSITLIKGIGAGIDVNELNKSELEQAINYLRRNY